jgi:hypothetical protein
LGFGKEKKEEVQGVVAPEGQEGDILSVPFTMASNSHTLFIRQSGTRLEVSMASRRDKVIGKFERAKQTVKNYEKYINDEVQDQEVKDEFQNELVPYITELLSESISSFVQRIERIDTAKERKPVLDEARAAAQEIINELTGWGSKLGIPDLTPEAVALRAREMTQKAWETAWRRKQEDVQNALQSFVPRIRVLDPKAELKIRGSLAKGKRFEGKVEPGGDRRFNPEDFDVDAFVESDDLARKALEAGALPVAGKIWASRSNIPKLVTLVREMRDALSEIAGLRVNKFDVVIRTTVDVRNLLREPEEQQISVKGPQENK